MTVAVSFLTWENLATFANYSFTTSLVGALAGAFAGAKAAQNIAERSKKKLSSNPRLEILI